MKHVWQVVGTSAANLLSCPTGQVQADCVQQLLSRLVDEWPLKVHDPLWALAGLCPHSHLRCDQDEITQIKHGTVQKQRVPKTVCSNVLHTQHMHEKLLEKLLVPKQAYIQATQACLVNHKCSSCAFH
jgi:hypothetical protein